MKDCIYDKAISHNCMRTRGSATYTSLLFPSFFPPLAPTLEPRADFSVFDYFAGGRTPWMGEQLVARPPRNVGQHKHIINTYTHQTSMPCVGFEHTTPASERLKTVHALDRSATVTGSV
jgi:hypothetical protein